MKTIIESYHYNYIHGSEEMSFTICIECNTLTEIISAVDKHENVKINVDLPVFPAGTPILIVGFAEFTGHDGVLVKGIVTDISAVDSDFGILTIKIRGN